jgi:hypothetical protein
MQTYLVAGRQQLYYYFKMLVQEQNPYDQISDLFFTRSLAGTKLKKLYLGRNRNSQFINRK